jgi:hypothetical protein
MLKIKQIPAGLNIAEKYNVLTFFAPEKNALLTALQELSKGA